MYLPSRSLSDTDFIIAVLAPHRILIQFCVSCVGLHEETRALHSHLVKDRINLHAAEPQGVGLMAGGPVRN